MRESIKCELYELEVYSDFIHKTITTIKCLYEPSSRNFFHFFENKKNFNYGINSNEKKWIISTYPFREGNRKFIKNVEIPIDIFNCMITITFFNF